MAEGTDIQVPIVKAKTTLSINTADIPDDVYQYALMLGLKALANRGMTTITGQSDDARAKALEKGKENLEAIKAGKVRMIGVAKAKGGDREVTTEARRIARIEVKEAIRKNGGKISHYSTRDITAAADALIASTPRITEEARENVKKRHEATTTVDIASLIKADPKLVAKAEAKKKPKKGEPISATQAGLVQRQRPQPQAHR